MDVTLFPHQILAYNQLREAIAEGHKRIMLAAPCAFGKTILALYLMEKACEKAKHKKQHPPYAAFLCDRIKLINQTVDKFGMGDFQIGVMQAEHELTNPFAEVQICSVQTLIRRHHTPTFNFGIIDEAHINYKYYQDLFELYSAVPFIGLSATPYSKGLGDFYTKLIVPATTQELLDSGYLVPVKYFGGKIPDLKGIRRVKNKFGGSDFHPEDLEKKMMHYDLIGDIVDNWEKLGEDSQTVCFTQSRIHSKGVVEAFKRRGIDARHVDHYTINEIRENLYQQHDEGEFKILSCCTLLDTGYDSPSTSCCIDAAPTKSIIRFVQRDGRIRRLCPDIGKEYAIYLDHAGNVHRHGYSQDISPKRLHKSSDRYKELDLVELKQEDADDEKERAYITCEKCKHIHNQFKCPACGHQPVFTKQPKVLKGDLVELTPTANLERRQKWFSMFMWHQHEKKYKDGWAAQAFKKKFEQWPDAKMTCRTKAPDDEVKRYIKYLQVRAAKGRNRYAKFRK